MASVLAWSDHDAKARERTLRILSLFQEKESRDELGLGSVRDSFADQLFPGTSTIQTRLRYMLFVPWIYHSLEEKRLPADRFAIQADSIERELVQPLMNSDDQAGVFGKTAGKKLKRLPSSVYWAGLGAWGIRLTPFSQEEYHRRIDDTYRRRTALKVLEKDAKTRGDDIDVELRMVEFPLIAFYKLKEGRRFLFGAYYSRILESRFETKGINGVFSDDKNITDNATLPGAINTVEYNFNNDLDKYDYGLLIGYRYNLNHRLYLWARLNVGFKSIFEKNFTNIDYEMYQVRINLGVSYKLYE